MAQSRISQRSRWGTKRTQISMRITTDLLEETRRRAAARGWGAAKLMDAALRMALERPEGQEFSAEVAEAVDEL